MLDRINLQIPVRVVQLLPLLASPIDGEALGACRALSRTLAASGLDFHDLAAALARKEAALPNAVGQAHPPVFDMARTVRDIGCGRLNADELRFVGAMLRLGRGTPTPRQAAWLARIYDRLTKRAAA